MKWSVACALVCVSACLAAEPPAQSDLPRQDLSRMRPDDRTALERLIGTGFAGMGEDAVIVSGPDAGIEVFNTRVAVIQPWSLTDAASQKAVEQVGEGLAGLEDVVLVALHGPEDVNKIKRLLERRGLPGTVVLDSEDRFITPLGLGARGANLIVDRNGAVRYAGVSAGAVSGLVRQLLGEEPDAGKAPSGNVRKLAASAASAAELEQKITDAWVTGDMKAGEALLEAAWTSDATAASTVARQLLNGQMTAQRVLGLEQLARHADVSTLLDVIRKMNSRSERLEMAILVRSLGQRQLDNAESVLTPFVTSRDVYVRQAALYALGDAGTPRLLRMFVGEMRTAPAARDTWSDDDDDRLMSTMFGVAYKLTGLRASTGREYQEWLNLYESSPERAEEAARRSITAANGQPNMLRFGSNEMRTYPGFDLGYQFQRPDPSLIDDRAPRQFVEELDAVCKRAEPVLGRVHAAPIRIYVGDDGGFSALVGNRAVAGQAEVNVIYIRHGPLPTMRAVLARTYGHILQDAMYADQPRWLSDGFALSMSSPESRWTMSTVRSANIDAAVQQGVFRRLIGWGGQATADVRDQENYQLSRLAVDFLRSGPYPAGNTRLRLVMGRISTGMSDREALAEFYAHPDDLDRQILEWLGAP
ncbi:MAG: hypothetical protein KJZ65_00660 [Phycisphaerales bacterium]|nr:hypothetical protein [Phycisphaerales bacterium]